ncbi:E3 ubiquitin-protein ligase TRIM71 [Trichinella spiralis]|uniref:E3 ubiquitin-protein ligase TRIM71 n=1 Tax=Trichinella spiralis TaxID=6334 RepID=A0A0V1BJR3_TRISP|nr:E3 ubiquitin-protein ligase TRIM71 [Trichinella spiralis]
MMMKFEGIDEWKTDSRRPFRSAVILSDILGKYLVIYVFPVSNVYYYSFLCQLVGQVTSSNGMTSDFSACRQGGVRTPLSFRHAMDTCVRCGRPATVVASLKQLNCAHLICAGCAHVRGLGACPLCMPLKEGSYEMLACRLSNSTTSADASGRSSVVSQQQQQQQQQLFNNDQLCPATSSPAVSRFYAPVQDTSLPPVDLKLQRKSYIIIILSFQLQACTADSHSGSFLPTTTITTTSAVPQTQFSGYRIPTALPRPNCSGCMGGVRAIAKCEDCQEFLCADCANCHHRTVGVKPHRILDLFSNSVHNYNSSDFNYHTNSQQQQQQCALTRMSQLSLCNGMNDHGISLCNVHLTDYTHIFCDGCLTFICPKCAVDHHGHGLRTTGGSLISPANEMDVKNTRRLLNSGHMHLKLVTDSLDSVNRMGNRLESRVTGLVKDIQTISQTLINALEERRLKWLEQLQSWRVLRMGKLSMCEEHLRHYRDRIQIAVAKLENLGSLNTADSDLWHHELEECIRTFPYELMPHEDDNLAFLSPKPFILMTIQQAGGLKTNASPIHSVVYGENGRQCVKGIEKPEGCDNVNETGERYLYVYICVYMDVRMLYMYILKLEIGQREDCMSTAVVTDKQLFVPGTRTCRCESRFTRFPLRKLSLLRIRSPLQGKFELSFINFTMRPSFKSTIKEDLGAIEEGKIYANVMYMVETIDYFNQPLRVGGDLVSGVVQQPNGVFEYMQVVDRNDGKYTCTFTPRMEGEHLVSLFVRGQAMPNCPLKLSVNGGRSYLTVSGRYPTNRFCSQGSGDGQLYRPWGIACDKLNRIIVADRTNHRIQIFDSEGRFLTKFGCQGCRDGQFDRPAGVAVTSSNDIVVVDKDNHRVQVFTSNGLFKLKFGEKGRDVGQFNYPWGVAVSPDDIIAVSDTRNHRVQLFTANGLFWRKFGYEQALYYKQFDSPRGVAFGPDGRRLFCTDFNNHRLVVYDLAAGRVTMHGVEGDAEAHFRRPQGIDVDTQGNLFVADSRNNRIQIFSPQMNFIASIDCGRGTSIANGTANQHHHGRPFMDTPTDVCVSPDGKVYVVDFGNNRILVF